MTHSNPISVSLLATPDTSASTLFGLFDVLSAAGLGWESFVSGEKTSPNFDVRIVCLGEGPVQCGNALVSPGASIADVDHSDIVVIASFAVPGIELRVNDQRELEWLSKLQARGSVIGAACTAASLMAESGMLDGLEATTFWAYRDLVRIHYPDIRWKLDQNLCYSGENNQFVTTGGATGWQELALYLIARFVGIEQASQAAKFWLIPDRGQSQAPYSANPKHIPHHDNVIYECQNWIEGNLPNPNPVATMARRSNLPPTTFARRFNRATGFRPMEYVHMLRVEKAKAILESSGTTIDEIGRRVGYQDPASFRRIFKRKVNLTPGVYRRQFGHGRFDRYLHKAN